MIATNEQPLTNWLQEHPFNPQNKYYDAALAQVSFVRYRLLPLFGPGSPDSRCLVCGTHSGKSNELPVYRWRNEVLDVVARCNFHDWNVSVRSLCRLYLPDYFEIDRQRQYLFFQGMEGYKYGPYSDDKRRFSFCVSSHYEMFSVTQCIAGQPKDLGHECVARGADPAAVGAWGDNRRSEYLQKSLGWQQAESN